MRKSKTLMPLLAMALTAGCGGENTGSNVQAPGEEKTAKSKALEAGADVLQDKTPLSKVDMYLDGFHFYNGHLEGQMEAHHYVTQINEDLHQAIIFDGNGENAKLMGWSTSSPKDCLKRCRKRRRSYGTATTMR
jgi:hypothetical protein